MVVKQSFNGRIRAWVKWDVDEDGLRILDVKEREPRKKFKGVPVHRR